MFDKGELAEILRFGAEDMFKASDVEEERDEALYGEDIDAILARAEVSQQTRGWSTGLYGDFGLSAKDSRGGERIDAIVLRAEAKGRA